jgi:hypothetical protein
MKDDHAETSGAVQRVGSLIKVGFPAGRTHARNIGMGAGFAIFLALIILAPKAAGQGVDSPGDLLDFLSTQPADFWVVLLVCFAAFAAIGYLFAAGSAFDLDRRLVLRRNKVYASLDDAAYLAVQRNPASFRRYDVLLVFSDDRCLHLCQDLKPGAQAVAGSLSAELGVPLAPPGTPGWTLGAGTRSEKALFWSAGILFLAFAVLLLVVGMFESGDGLSAFGFALVFCIAGLVCMQCALHLHKPPSERPRYIFEARTLWLLGTVALAYAIYGLVNAWNDISELISDPSLVKLLESVDGLQPVAALLVTVWLYTLAWRRR